MGNKEDSWLQAIHQISGLRGMAGNKGTSWLNMSMISTPGPMPDESVFQPRKECLCLVYWCML